MYGILICLCISFHSRVHYNSGPVDIINIFEDITNASKDVFHIDVSHSDELLFCQEIKMGISEKLPQ